MRRITHRNGFPPITILIGIMIVLILLVLTVGFFYGEFLGIGESANQTAASADIDYCDSVISSYCRSIPDADWSEAYEECEQHADIIGDGSTECSAYTGTG